MLPTDVDIPRASDDDKPNPAAPVGRLNCACWWGCNDNRLVGHASSKNNDSSAVPRKPSKFFQSPHRAAVCLLGGQGQPRAYHSLGTGGSQHHGVGGDEAGCPLVWHAP